MQLPRRCSIITTNLSGYFANQLLSWGAGTIKSLFTFYGSRTQRCIGGSGSKMATRGVVSEADDFSRLYIGRTPDNGRKSAIRRPNEILLDALDCLTPGHGQLSVSSDPARHQTQQSCLLGLVSTPVLHSLVPEVCAHRSSGDRLLDTVSWRQPWFTRSSDPEPGRPMLLR